MEMTFTCPQCQTVGRLAAVEDAREAPCARCGFSKVLRAEATVEGHLASCPWCATDELYIQKDFPQGLGLAILVVGFAISTFFYYAYNILATFAVLLASVFFDWWLYRRVPDVTICYRCLSQYRGSSSNPGGRYRPFDLAIGERYRQERLRIEQMRKVEG